MSDWRPIETAPRDGTAIDLWAYCEEHNHWGRRPDCAWERMADWDGSEFEGWAGLQRGTWWSCHWANPTHWMPIPKPPEGTGTERESVVNSVINENAGSPTG